MVLLFLLRRPAYRVPALTLWFAVWLCSAAFTAADEDPAAKAAAEAKAKAEAEAKEEKARRQLAVALNYCRASFHRINKYQTEAVLRQEQQKILNNLNLSSIDDAQVVSLYTNVVQEINQIQLVERERDIIESTHNRAFYQRLFINSMALGTQVATFNYLGAVQTGVGSFWDYRSKEIQTENDTWKLDKAHMSSLVSKTTQFIETSWKLARDRKIPDAWLVRDIDLEQLERTLAERDLTKRLRILARMEPYMVCYPPYYYYVARTQQALGQLDAASETYRKLDELESGNFRNDEMLAAGLANLASIERYLQRGDAVVTARKALRNSTDVWEANLICANILSEHGDYRDAEDAVLRNLDVGLEFEASRNSLAMLYTRSGDSSRLASRLEDPEFVKSLRGPVLLQCAQAMQDRPLPPQAARQLLASFNGYVDVGFGRDDLVLNAADDWNLPAAEIKVSYAGVDLGKPEVIRGNGFTQLRYRGILEVGTPWKRTATTRPLAVQIAFPQQPAVAFQFHPSGTQAALTVVRATTAPGDRTPPPGGQQNGYMLTEVHSPQYVVAMDGSPAKVFGTTDDPQKQTVPDPSEPGSAEPELNRPQFLPAANSKQSPGLVELLMPE